MAHMSLHPTEAAFLDPVALLMASLADCFSWNVASSLTARTTTRPLETRPRKRLSASSSCGLYVSKRREAITAPVASFNTNTWRPRPDEGSASSKIYVVVGTHSSYDRLASSRLASEFLALV